MSKILKETCSLCGGHVPEQCDGREFELVYYTRSRRLCKGRDGIFKKKNGQYYYHYVMGHGGEWDTEVMEKKN